MLRTFNTFWGEEKKLNNGKLCHIFKNKSMLLAHIIIELIKLFAFPDKLHLEL